MSKPYTVGMALCHLTSIDAAAAKVARAALRPLFPDTAAMSAGEFAIFLNLVPLPAVAIMLNAEGSGWSPEVKADLIARGFASATHLTNYAREARRLVALGEKLRVRPKKIEILPEWVALNEDHFLPMVPATTAQVAIFKEAGVKLVGVYDLSDLTLKQAVKIADQLRWSFKTLCCKASAAGLPPRDFGREVLRGERLKDVASFTPAGTYHYYAKNAWNAVVDTNPELGLPTWPERTRRVGTPMNELPAELREGTEAAFFSAARCDSLEATSVKTFRTAVTGYYGILAREGIDLSFTVGIAPKDAFRLLWQSLPREIVGGDPEADAPLALASRIMRDTSFRNQVIAAMRAMEGMYDGLEAVANPFVAIVIEARYQDNQYSAARNLVHRARDANGNYLAVRGRHMDWINRLDKEIKNLETRAKTPNKAKKKQVFKYPKLWLHLMKRLDVMVFEFGRLNPGTPRWATTLRNLVFVYMLLLIPMRINAYLHMELDRHFDPEAGTIHFDADEVKNDVEIDYELPTKGPHARLRSLIELYLVQARPLLLQGATSPYMFVPDRSAPNAGLHIRVKGFNEILKDLSDRHFRDVLPRSLGWLNPHLVRHIVATYQVVVLKNWVRAAQLLGNKMETVLEFYADVLGSASADVRDFYNGLEDDKPDDDLDQPS